MQVLTDTIRIGSIASKYWLRKEHTLESRGRGTHSLMPRFIHSLSFATRGPNYYLSQIPETSHGINETFIGNIYIQVNIHMPLHLDVL
jgi:hypothetical protein